MNASHLPFHRLLVTLSAVLIGLAGSVALAPPSVAGTLATPAMTTTAGIANAAEGCPVDGATITWGFKESFRSYISGSIANGEWTVADGATYTTPDFGWDNGTGSFAAEGGLVAFPGSVTFTGHGGILNTTVANPQLKFISDDTAMLVFDVSGTTQDGASVDATGVEFVEIALAGVAEQADGVLTVTAAPTTLTPAGSTAFGTYEAGEQFDPISFAIPVGADCAITMVAAPTTTATAAPTATAEPAAATADLSWLWILIAGVLLLVIVAGTVIVVRRRST